MSLRMDSHKWKAIWLAIDIVLLALVLCILGYCGYLAWSIQAIPDAEGMHQKIQEHEETVAGLEADIVRQTQAVTQAEEESQAVYQAAADALAAAQAELDAAAAQLEALNTQKYNYENADALEEQLKVDLEALRTEYGQTVRKLEDKILAGESDYKICYLTFDDGPSYYTSRFLDQLDELDIYVTFFTIGVQMSESGAPLRNELLRREALSGHSIANHTYTHAIETSLYKSLDNFLDAVNRQDQLVYEVTGLHPNLFRFPAGSYYCPFRTKAIAALTDMGYGWIDWTGNAYDSGNFRHSSDRVARDVIWQVRQESVIVVLMHDWRTETLGALETIVTTLKEENYLFLPLFKESSTVGTAFPKWD